MSTTEETTPKPEHIKLLTAEENNKPAAVITVYKGFMRERNAVTGEEMFVHMNNFEVETSGEVTVTVENKDINIKADFPNCFVIASKPADDQQLYVLDLGYNITLQCNDKYRRALVTALTSTKTYAQWENSIITRYNDFKHKLGLQ